MKKVLAVFLSALFVLPCLCLPANAFGIYKPDGLSQEYYSMMSDGNDELLLGSISAKYESNGKPETISTGADSGGVSYGAYQFSSRYDVPLSFANWCVSSGAGVVTGSRLVAAYGLDGNTYGANFDAIWKAIAAEDSSAFLLLQHDYTKAKFYDVMVAKLESAVPGFKVNNYTIALKNAIWSRAVQHGVNSDVILAAFQSIGGFSNQTEDVLIKAIYAQSAKLVIIPPSSNSVMITLDSAQKYGVDPLTVAGKYMYYFSLNSSDIQVSVYRRLAVNELKDVLSMYDSYAGTVTPVEDDNSNSGSLLSSIITLLTTLTKLFIKLINSIAALFSTAA